MGSKRWDPHVGWQQMAARPSTSVDLPIRCLAQVGAGAPLHGGECCVELDRFAQVGLAKHKPAKRKRRVLLRGLTMTSLI